MVESNSALKMLDHFRRYGIAKWNFIPAPYLKKDGLTYPTSETSQKSTGMKSNDLTSYVEVFHARISASQENKEESLKEKQGVVFGENFTRRSGYFDQDSCSLKTSQRLLLTDSTSCLVTLQKRGMMRSGVIYAHPTSEHPTKEKESSSSHIPTPTRSDATTGSIIGKNDKYKVLPSGALRKITQQGVDGSIGLARYVKFFPTPTVREWKGARTPEALAKSGRKPNNSLGDTVRATQDGKLNPQFVEWLMGLPEDWTLLSGKNASKLWATVSSQRRRNTLASKSLKPLKKVDSNDKNKEQK